MYLGNFSNVGRPCQGCQGPEGGVVLGYDAEYHFNVDYVSCMLLCSVNVGSIIYYLVKNNML